MINFDDNCHDNCNTQTIGECSEAEGCYTKAKGECSHAEGYCTKSIGLASHSEGCVTTALGECSHAEGFNTKASGIESHAEGEKTVASAEAAHAEGFETVANANESHAEGALTEASGFQSHAEGFRTIASGNRAHAEGTDTIAYGVDSHAEGDKTIASASQSHAEGAFTKASGFQSHAEGLRTTASGNFSHAEGNDTNTANFDGAHIMGQFGDACEAYGWFMAGGSDTNNRAITACIKNSGDAYFNSVDIENPCCNDFAEMFETITGETIDVGYFITCNGNKIRKATSSDSYILGITSATPAIIGGSCNNYWQDRYLKDKWGRIQYEKSDTCEGCKRKPILNPNYNPSRKYISRRQRPEWVAVGLIGQLLVRDDGSCKVNGYCRPNNDGVATASDKGYRVLKRTDSDQILILFLTQGELF